MGRSGLPPGTVGGTMAAWRTGLWLTLAVLAAAGCRAPTRPTPLPPVTPPPPPPHLPVVRPTSLEPDYRTLPVVDPTAAEPDDVAPPPAGYRGITEEVCRREAASRAGVPGLFGRENRIPPRRTERG